ncbi:Methyl-CpG-binding domain-containing protein 9 [Apostasia shenzhenica]|uniref:Methyl-CpG-binding domain-containing protein 9 n=1 Tax=Apostasia shenzhenica TaxID=1088818 RepID=A0A2I0B1T7_9ASPA|nr:Methyl-CpG-binding domain-containing protein 9 [Apostasia shenzhenica]
MELVGMAIRKCFLGFGTFSGFVESHDAAAGLFKIRYENGASEEVGLDEIAAILREMGLESRIDPLPRRSGRGRPRKRRCLDLGNLHAVDGVSGEAVANGFCVSGEKLGRIVGCDVDGGKNGYLIDCPEEKASLGGLDVRDSPKEEVLPDSAGERRDEDLGGEGVLFDADRNDEESVGKRRKLSRQAKLTPDMPLRRSARRASASLLSSLDGVTIKNETAFENGEPFCKTLEYGTQYSKSPLPPSSSVLDIDGLSVLDLFSVYSCLRSFSRSLFLSPFSLEALVAALRCKYANPLIDSIHFSILWALKTHLEQLMEEGSQSAKDCLRNLNWDLLDLVTWPVFLAEYLVLRVPALRKTFKLITSLKILDVEYYQQPAEVKLEILCCLCDNVVEVECLRSELHRRVTEVEYSGDLNYNMNFSRKQRYSMRDGESSILQGDVDDLADWNSDECCLCRMDGILICCDGCPAAFHSRCVGVAKDLLPDGEWYCPECVVNKDGVVSSLTPFKGADILGRDLHGRLYSACCGYLLVFNSCHCDVLCHYYHKNDLYSVIKILKSEPSPSDEIGDAISAYWGFSINSSFSSYRYACDDDNVSQQVLDGKFSGTSFLVGDTERVSCLEPSDAVASLQSSTVSAVLLEENPNKPTSSKQTANMVDAISVIQTSLLNGGDFSVDCSTSVGSFPGKSTEQVTGREGSSEKKRTSTSHLPSDPCNYVNYYRFGLVTAAMAQELLSKSSKVNDKSSLKSDEFMKSDQLKIISKKSLQWHWYECYNRLDIQKEDCGWCFACKKSSDAECLFKVIHKKHLEAFKINVEGSTDHAAWLHSEKIKRSQILFAIDRILLIEDRVRSLLLGSWENLREQWRRSVMQADDVASVKFLLLALESNLRRVALSPEWLKAVDSDRTVGSASFSMKEFIWWRGGKQSRQQFRWKMLPRTLASKSGRQAGFRKISSIFYPDGSEFAKRNKCIAWQVAVEMSKNLAQLLYLVKEFDSNIKWEEISSSQLFLPLTKESKTLAKLFKQTVIRKKCVEGAEVKYLLDFGKRELIPAIVTKHGKLFEESSDKRKRFWLNEIYIPLSLIGAYEEKKLSRSLKKKDAGNTNVKRTIFKLNRTKQLKGLSYLFSRKQNSEKHLCGHCNKHVLVGESVNCQYCDGFFHRKHFRVPKGTSVTVYTCLKCKEKETVTKSAVPPTSGKKRKVSAIWEGNSISMSKKSKQKQDSMIKSNKNMVSLAKKSKERQLSMTKKSKGAMISLARKSKKKLPSMVISVRKNPVRMVRKAQQNIIQLANKSKLKPNKNKIVVVKKKKRTVRKSRYSVQSEKLNYANPDCLVNCCKKKRTICHHSYWLNGLLWVKDPAGERGRSFREKKVLLPLQPAAIQPICSLCHRDYDVGLIYVSCETCGDWFHGDAFGLELDSISYLAGLKCHKCCLKHAPVCPFWKDPAISVIESNKGCITTAEAVDGEHQQKKNEPKNLANEENPTVTFSEDHPYEVISEAACSTCEGQLVVSGEIMLEPSGTVELSDHHNANATVCLGQNVAEIRITSHIVEEGTRNIAVVSEEILLAADHSSELHKEVSSIGTSTPLV